MCAPIPPHPRYWYIGNVRKLVVGDYIYVPIELFRGVLMTKHIYLQNNEYKSINVSFLIRDVG